MTVDRCPQTLWDDGEPQCVLAAGHADGHLYDIRRQRHPDDQYIDPNSSWSDPEAGAS